MTVEANPVRRSDACGDRSRLHDQDRDEHPRATASQSRLSSFHGANTLRQGLALRPSHRRVIIEEASRSIPLALVVSGANLAKAKVAAQAGNGEGGCASLACLAGWWRSFRWERSMTPRVIVRSRT